MERIWDDLGKGKEHDQKYYIKNFNKMFSNINKIFIYEKYYTYTSHNIYVYMYIFIYFYLCLVPFY